MDFNELPEDIKNEFIEAVKGDTLSPESLYKNVINSTGTTGQIANIFELPFGLVLKVRELNKLI